MAATLMTVNERAHVDLNDDELGESRQSLVRPIVSFFTGRVASGFTVATSMVGCRTFRPVLRAMRRGDLADEPRLRDRGGAQALTSAR